MKKNTKIVLVGLIVASFLIAAAAAIAGAPSCKRQVDFSAEYYFVCYESPDDSHTASSITSSVQSYGGAGYMLEWQGKYYVTIACYYTPSDADKVCSSLRQSGLTCQVLCASVSGYKLSSGQKGDILGGLNCLEQSGRLLYDTANGLDGGTISQAAALGVMNDIVGVLEEVKRQNQTNSLAENAEYIHAMLDDVSYGYIYARDVRAVQIAVCDVILHLKFA